MNNQLTKNVLVFNSLNETNKYSTPTLSKNNAKVFVFTNTINGENYFQFAWLLQKTGLGFYSAKKKNFKKEDLQIALHKSGYHFYELFTAATPKKLMEYQFPCSYDLNASQVEKLVQQKLENIVKDKHIKFDDIVFDFTIKKHHDFNLSLCYSKKRYK